MSRGSSVRRNAASLRTANGGANVPRKFLASNALMPFFTPTPESFCASTVVGTRTSRTPRCVDRRRVADRVEHRAAADREHERVAVDAEPVQVGLDRLDHRRRLLDLLAALHDPGRLEQLQARGVRLAVGGDVARQVGPGVRRRRRR